MQYSKAEKSDYSEAQILKKLEKIRLEISSAEDYIRLQKCSTKLAKLQTSVSLHPDKRSRKELKAMVEACEGLIKQKTKYFKKKLISQLSHQSKKDDSYSKEKTLKYSKSVQNFQMEPTHNVQPPRRQLTKNDEEELWGNRTEVRGREPQRLQQLMEQLKDEMTVYKNKVALLQRPASNLSYRLNEQQMVFEQDVSLKLKERGHEIEELKGRLRYFEQTNQELRNRLTNQQKRQDDYVGTLKDHISKLQNEIEFLGRQNRKLRQQLAKEVTNNNQLQIELQRLVEETQFLHREKRQRQQSEVLRLKDSGMRKELIALSQQEKYIRQMESILQHEKEEQALLRQEMEALKKKEKQYQEQILALEREKQKLGEAAELDSEQIKALKKQLTLSMEMVRQGEHELLEAKRQLVRMSEEAGKEQMRKEVEVRRKVEHLRQIKSLIEGK